MLFVLAPALVVLGACQSGAEPARKDSPAPSTSAASSPASAPAAKVIRMHDLSLTVPASWTTYVFSPWSPNPSGRSALGYAGPEPFGQSCHPYTGPNGQVQGTACGPPLTQPTLPARGVLVSVFEGAVGMPEAYRAPAGSVAAKISGHSAWITRSSGDVACRNLGGTREVIGVLLDDRARAEFTVRACLVDSRDEPAVDAVIASIVAS
jgi:hypothetical protein